MILGEYVSPVIIRSLSNVTGNLKKAVRLGGYLLNTFILEFLSCGVSLSQNLVRKAQIGILFANGYKKNTSQ